MGKGTAWHRPPEALRSAMGFSLTSSENAVREKKKEDSGRRCGDIALKREEGLQKKMC